MTTDKTSAIIGQLLYNLDPHPNRAGLRGTPKRVSKAWQEWTSGYGVDVSELLTTFEDGSENYDQMVSVVNMPFYSHCEHHLAPFFGTATIAYIPKKRIVGLSKLSRVLNVYAKRLQVQERMTNQIADALNSNLECVGVGVYIKARHLCMESRGISIQGSHTNTTALRGAILDEASTRNEFLSLCRTQPGE